MCLVHFCRYIAYHIFPAYLYMVLQTFNYRLIYHAQKIVHSWINWDLHQMHWKCYYHMLRNEYAVIFFNKYYSPWNLLAECFSIRKVTYITFSLLVVSILPLSKGKIYFFENFTVIVFNIYFALVFAQMVVIVCSNYFGTSFNQYFWFTNSTLHTL